MTHVTYRDTAPPAPEFARLFDTTGWNAAYRVTETELHAALRGSWRLVSAWCNERLVGIGRLLSDGSVYALVVDVIVDPDWQQSGIGTAIVERLVDHADRAGIRDVLLFAADGTEPFYVRRGFRARPASAPGMVRRRKPRASPGAEP